jgi:hypothetical protein
VYDDSLRLTGLRIDNGYYIASTLVCINPQIFSPLVFKIDTSADITTISLNDATNSRMDFSKLGEPFEGLGISGTVPTYAINDCALSFVVGNCVISEKMEQVYISSPTITSENYNMIKQIPSLLGIDFLQRYTIRFDNMFAYLDR